jgi:glycogen debranching enzyme
MAMGSLTIIESHAPPHILEVTPWAIRTLPTMNYLYKPMFGNNLMESSNLTIIESHAPPHILEVTPWGIGTLSTMNYLYKPMFGNGESNDH